MSLPWKIRSQLSKNKIISQTQGHAAGSGHDGQKVKVVALRLKAIALLNKSQGYNAKT